MVMDALVRHFTRGRQHYDRDARMATRGQLLPALLDHAARRTIFPPAAAKNRRPRTIRPSLCREILSAGDAATARDPKTWFAPRPSSPRSPSPTPCIAGSCRERTLAQLIVSGGGARNPLIMAQLSAALAGIEILPSEALGVPGDAKEAFAFALLADETAARPRRQSPQRHRRARPAILGKICHPPPRR